MATAQCGGWGCGMTMHNAPIAPEGMAALGTQTFVPAMPQAILGTRLDGKPNWMALAWVTRVNHVPPMLGVVVNNRHASHGALVQTGAFSVCFPSVAQLVATDYVGIVSGKRVDKSGVFTPFDGALPDAPCIAECPLCFQCRLTQTVTLPSNTLFIGDIVAVWGAEACLTDGVPDVRKMQPFSLTMPDNGYWSVGQQVGKAWSDGKQYKDVASSGK